MQESKYHFIGIGGIGMSALARILLERGDQVSGSDMSPSVITEELEKRGALIHKEHSDTHIDAPMTIVYSSSISKSHPEMKKAHDLNIPILHRCELLERLLSEKKSLVVSGTHGKTTTSSVLASVLLHAEYYPSFAIGGLLKEFGVNGLGGKGEYFVAEGDESDGSFLRTSPFGGILTNIDSDHLDYWKSEEALIKAFKQFADQVESERHFLWCADNEQLNQLNIKGISYGFAPHAQARLSRFKQNGWEISFDIAFEGKTYEKIDVTMIGKHNALNAAAVFILALQLGVDEMIVRSALKKFQGVKRRQEKIGCCSEIAIYDDYAHHPVEVKETLKAFESAARERRIIAVFQPHRYSRVKELWKEFSCAFNNVDQLFITDIYSANEEPVQGIEAEKLATEISTNSQCSTTYVPFDQLCDRVWEFVRPHDIVITLGAGSITSFGPKLLKALQERAQKQLKVSLIAGGKSAENTVSLSSSSYIERALDREIYQTNHIGITKYNAWTKSLAETKAELFTQTSEKNRNFHKIINELLESDICIPIMHGPNGEDGMIHGFLETLDIAYTGCDFRSSAVCMDKIWAKDIVSKAGIDVTAYFGFASLEWQRNAQEILEKIERELSYPLFIKPSHLGSTIGIKRATNREQLIEAIENANHYDFRIIVEEEAEGRRDIEVAILGNDQLEVSYPGEIYGAIEGHDFAGKYGSNPNPYDVVSKLPPELAAEVQDLAVRIYRLLGCFGMSRVDFLLDRHNHIFFNEINPIPGFTPTSPYPQMLEALGKTAEEIIDQLIISGLRRKKVVDDKFLYTEEQFNL